MFHRARGRRQPRSQVEARCRHDRLNGTAKAKPSPSRRRASAAASRRRAHSRRTRRCSVATAPAGFISAIAVGRRRVGSGSKRTLAPRRRRRPDRAPPRAPAAAQRQTRACSGSSAATRARSRRFPRAAADDIAPAAAPSSAGRPRTGRREPSAPPSPSGMQPAPAACTRGAAHSRSRGQPSRRASSLDVAVVARRRQRGGCSMDARVRLALAVARQIGQRRFGDGGVVRRRTAQLAWRADRALEACRHRAPADRRRRATRPWPAAAKSRAFVGNYRVRAVFGGRDFRPALRLLRSRGEFRRRRARSRYLGGEELNRVPFIESG